MYSFMLKYSPDGSSQRFEKFRNRSEMEEFEATMIEKGYTKALKRASDLFGAKEYGVFDIAPDKVGV